MSFDKYLLNLANISNEIGHSLTYGYGDIAATEINFLKALIAKSEEMIPILEAEACFNEAEELDREERSFNYWMTMLYGNDSVSSIDIHNTNKTNRLKRRKQNKKHHKADRRHGKPVPQSDKKYWDEQNGTYYRWDEKKKTFFSPKKPKVHRNKKTFRDRLNHSMREREIDFLSAMEILDRSNAIFFQAKEETDPIRQKQLEDTAYELLCAGCVDFYYGAVTGHKGTYFPDLAVGI